MKAVSPSISGIFSSRINNIWGIDMVGITELGYIGLGVKSLADWKKYAAGILGAEVVDAEEAGRCYVRLDNWHHRLIVDEDGTDDLNYLGFRVAGVEEFREMQEKLTQADISFTIGSREEAMERHVLEILKLKDPSGTPLEIFHGPHIQPNMPFYPGRRMHGGFTTGDGGLGHVLLSETVGLDKTYEFYKLLGMRGSIEYQIPIPGQDKPFEILFLHCNSRDHTLAFGLPSQKRLNHIMLEYQEFDDIGLSHEIVEKKEVPIGMKLGKHSNDHMYSFYIMNPSGWMFELGWGGRPATHQSETYRGDIYGHTPPK
ncbi:MAG: VOC family protein [Pseudomonadales bacterium]|nr:VOC family protein [Pseudomonadales bacterium]